MGIPLVVPLSDDPSSELVRLGPAKVGRQARNEFRSLLTAEGLTIDYVIRIALNDWLEGQGKARLFSEERSLRGQPSHKGD